MEDPLGIVYLVENAQQFWSELDDILNLGREPPTLQQLDSTLKRYLDLCATYHEQYLQSPLQFDHACDLLLDSDLFAFHSHRMCELLVEDIHSNTNPHSQLVFYHVLLCYGRRLSDFFRSNKRWQPLMPLLMDHVRVDIDHGIEDAYFGNAGTSTGSLMDTSVPIEAKLRSLSVRLLYEVSRVQKMTMHDLRIFDDQFIDCLFDLVEQTRGMHDETFNYSVIKLIVSLNEQFMVASLNTENGSEHTEQPSESKNRILRVLMRRIGSSKTFGENMIFMLNRAQRTPEDLCMQLLILKILYLLFTTKGTSEYFYTNDLCVLVDVFLRELVDLDDDSESLRHTYLRVLHPLLTKTQLREVPYKRTQIVYTLESLTSHARIRDINPTTKRLVERCLNGGWCVQLRKADKSDNLSPTDSRLGTPTSEKAGARSQLGISSVNASTHLDNSKVLKSSKSFEFVNNPPTPHEQRPSNPSVEKARRPSNASSLSLSGAYVANAVPPTVAPPRRKGSANSAYVEGAFATRHQSHTPGTSSELGLHHHRSTIAASSTNNLPSSASTLHPVPVNSPTAGHASHQRRTAPPPPPPKRRKPPAIPAGRTNGGATMTTIKSSLATNSLNSFV